MPNRRTIPLLVLSLALFPAALACRAATDLVFSPSPAPEETSAAEPTVLPQAPVESAPAIDTPEPITCTDDSCLNACLERVNEVMPALAFEPLNEAYAGRDANFNLVVYDVEAGELSEPAILYTPETYRIYQEDFAAQQRAWNFAVAFLPPDHLKWVRKFEIFTDGPYKVTAWVSSEDTDRSQWTLAVDVIDSGNPIDLTYVLAHEFGHLITLNTDQIPDSDYFYGWSQNAEVCPQFMSPRGCSNPDSYIQRFHQEFWKEIFEEWLETVQSPRANSQAEFEALVDAFYNRHEDLFLYSYAAANIYEDMAESFMYFVLGPKPAGSSVVQRKVLFFYDFPELVQARQQMIQGMCGYLE